MTARRAGVCRACGAPHEGQPPEDVFTPAQLAQAAVCCRVCRWPEFWDGPALQPLPRSRADAPPSLADSTAATRHAIRRENLKRLLRAALLKHP